VAFGDGGTGARPGPPSANADDRAGKPERAVLVGVELTVRSRATRLGLAGARLAASRSPETAEQTASDSHEAVAKPLGAGSADSGDSTALDADESLA